MRHQLLIATTIVGLASSTSTPAEPPPVPDANVAEAKAIIKSFFGSLKGELETAVAQGGPQNAVMVCKARAPVIADTITKDSGWDVGRTSLKLRNPQANAPDAWETEVLEHFEQRKADGEPVETIVYAETVETDDGSEFRFMKAIPTLEVCLACHGTDLTPEVVEALDQAYPDDQARGFSLGDIRGAFTLSKPL